MNVDIPITVEVEGWYSLRKFKVDAEGIEIQGTSVEPVPPFKNIITNGGLDRMGANADWLLWCQVGSGSTPAAATDTQLVARINSNNGGQSANVSGNQSTAPYFAYRTITYQFNAGAATGNLSEVGVGWLTTGGLFSRALIVDGVGNPTTITVLADEVLQVTYQFRYYAPETDITGTVALNGVTINWTSRAAMVATTGWWGIGSGNVTGVTAAIRAPNPNAYSGAIQAVTLSPAGTAATRASQVDQAYSSGSYTREAVVQWGLADANFAGGIQAVQFAFGAGVYQIGFSPAIMKVSTQNLSLTFSHSWARKTI